MNTELVTSFSNFFYNPLSLFSSFDLVFVTDERGFDVSGTTKKRKSEGSRSLRFF